MSDVIRPDFGNKDEEPEDPHLEGPATCMNCRHEFHVVAPAGTVNFECPRCATEQAVLSGVPVYEKPTWQCQCGNEFFMIHDEFFVCAHCGVKQVFE